MLYLGIEGRYDEVSHHTIYLAEDYRQNLRDIEELHRLSDDPSFYVQNACVTDPSLAPKKMSTLYVLLPVTHEHRNVNWNTEKARFRSLALQQLEKIGIKDLERRIRFEKVVTPAGLAFGVRLAQRLYLQHGAQSKADAPSAAAQSV